MRYKLVLEGDTIYENLTPVGAGLRARPILVDQTRPILVDQPRPF